MSGFIKLHRGWRDCDAFKDEPCSQREAWVWLLENAAWKPCQRRDAQKVLVQVERGQFHTSIRTLAAAWKWSRGRVERFLNDLKTSRMIDHQTGHGGLLITICNYDKYQGDGPSAGPTSEPSTGPRTGQAQGHTRRNDKNREEGKNDSSPRKRWVECPEGISAEVWQDWRSHRKTVFTDTALRGLLREADKAGWTAEQAICEAIERGWQGFKAEWVKGKQSKGDARGSSLADIGEEVRRLYGY